MSELENIADRYSRRSEYNENPVFLSNAIREKENILSDAIHHHFDNLSGLTVLEIGAGSGANIDFFLKTGIDKKNISANELLNDRIEAFRKNYPDIELFSGDAMNIPENRKFDIVYQSTVFSSVLNHEIRKKLAKKMLDLNTPGGLILWYDFTFNNPRNPDVRKVTRSEIRELFQGCDIKFKKVTLAPPIGRRVGKLYKIVNLLFPFLRSHLIAIIRKR